MRNNSMSATAYAFLLTIVLAFAVGSATAQGSPKPGKRPANDVVSTPAQTPNPITSSAAYAEVLLRKTELQADLDAWTHGHNQERTHQGKMCCGRTPMATFDEGKRICREKMIS